MGRFLRHPGQGSGWSTTRLAPHPPRGSDHHVRAGPGILVALAPPSGRVVLVDDRPLPDGWLGQDAMLFYFQRRHHPEHKKSVGVYGACLLDERSLRALAEEIDVHADSRPFWTPDLSAFLIGFKRFLFNVLLFLGSLPEEYEPESVLRPAREKKGRFRPELRAARFLGKEAYRPVPRTEGKAEHEPTGRELPGHWRVGHWRRQAFGEGSLQRKLIWIQPYKTAGLDA
jgi:hypothetical protein